MCFIFKYWAGMDSLKSTNLVSFIKPLPEQKEPEKKSLDIT